VIGDADIDSQHRSERSQQALGLTQRLMEHQAKREAGLDGDRRIDWLTAPLSGSRSMPGLNGFFGSGSTGAFAITVDTSIGADVYFSDITIAPGKTLHTNGYRVFVSGTLTLGDGSH